MAKLRGVKKWEHRDDVVLELIELEILLDSLSQHALRNWNSDEACYVCLQDCGFKQLSKALGIVRSLLAKTGYKQKTLKRWTKPAPNQLYQKEAKVDG